MFLAFPVLPPNTCGVCTRVPDPDELFLDTGSERINNQGGADHLYLCAECAGRAAVEMGFVTQTEYNDAVANLASTLDELDRLNDELSAALNPVVDRVLALVAARVSPVEADDATPETDEG